MAVQNNETSQDTCNYCKNFIQKEFLGEEILIEKLKKEEKIGVTVSGGKDSLYMWHWAVEKLGKDKVIAFNHRKVGMVHPLASENIERASKILISPIVFIDDKKFSMRFPLKQY